MFYRNYLLPIGLLAGAIIGAGIFALPYVFNTSGLPLGFIYLAVAVGVYTLIHLAYADVILRTKEPHRFVGYVRQYLGGGAGALAIFMTVVEMLFVLTIYLVLSPSFSALLGPGTLWQNLGIFWVLGSAVIFLNLKRIAALEFWITGGIVAIVGMIFVIGFRSLPSLNFVSWPVSLGQAAAPLAPVLFALSGRVAISSLVDYFREISGGNVKVSLVRRAIVGATLLSAIVYGLFVLAVAALSPVVSQDAVSGLRGVITPVGLAIFGVLGLLSLFSSYLAVGDDVRKILSDDLNFPAWAAALTVVAAPPIFYFLGFSDFLPLVGFVGGIFLSFEAIFIVWMWYEVNKVISAPSIMARYLHPVVYATILLFVVAMVYEVSRFVL